MADAAISTLLELLGDQLIQKVKFLRGVKGNVELLRDELKRMQSFLRDANKKQYEDQRVRNWISEIRELAQDAEDTIEIFLLNAESKGMLGRLSSLPKHLYYVNKVGKEIESIRSRLAAIKESRVTYGINDLGEAVESEVEWQPQLLPEAKGENLVGLEDDVETVLRESILDEKKKGFSVTFLEGIGGIGKSTLAREIYNHRAVKSGRFDCRAWVVVSSEFTPEETIKQLIMELPGADEQKLKELEKMGDKQYRLRKLKEMLGEQLKGKSYFIVLDDVWQKEHLESLISDFPYEEGKTSRILVTTRIKIITKYDQYVHKMKVLDTKKGWELLLKKAFSGSTSNGKCPKELESIGREILEKCCGLPLAISVVGGLMVGTQTKSDWEQVLKQINFHLGRDEGGVFAILELSYRNLPPQLKSCFLCLSFFKEDFTIPAKRLVNIWDSQGLIQQEGSRSIDEIGRGYLNELINRSMLQIEDLTFGGDRVKSCRIHDLVREVCLRKAEEEIGLEMVKEGKEGTSTSSCKPRHRVVYGDNLETCSSHRNKHIRSLFLLNIQGGLDVTTAPSNYWKSYQLLKTLELDDFVFNRLSNSFRLLIGLKCLRMHITDHWPNLDLPSWFDHLKNLEILDMGRCGVRFPRLLPLKMERLRYLSACITRGPTQISSWKNIECLKEITHKDWMRCGSNLTSGCRLRELHIRFKSYGPKKLEPEELEKVKASLEKLQNLVILHLSGEIYGDPIDIGLAMPNHLASLTKLKLNYELPKCPIATMFPPNLSHLTLMGSELYDDPMAELGNLPKLSVLKLKYSAYMGEKMQVSSGSFPCLEALNFVYLLNLKSIVIEEGGMPKLKHLRIHICPNLDTSNLPEHINISRQ